MISHLQPSPRQMKHPSGHDGAGIPKWCLQIQRTPSKKDMSPNFRKPLSKGKSLQTTFFSLEHVTFRSFRGDNNFSNPTRILNRYIIYASIQMDTNPYDTHPWITFQTAFWDPSNPGTLKTPHVLFLLNILCWFLKHEALGSNFCWVSRNVVQNFNPKQPLKSWLLIHTDWNDSETTNEISSQCHCGNCALHTTFGGVCVRNWYAFFCQTFIPRHHLDA